MVVENEYYKEGYETYLLTAYFISLPNTIKTVIHQGNG